MSEFTIKGFTKLLELKGYNELFQFYCPSADFIDRAEAGLLRMQQALSSQEGPQIFSMSGYPVWEAEGMPYVTSYYSCRFDGDKCSIESLSLSYQNGVPNGEIFSQGFEWPTMLDIPDREEMKLKLQQAMGLGEEPVQRKNNRLRL